MLLFAIEEAIFQCSAFFCSQNDLKLRPLKLGLIKLHYFHIILMIFITWQFYIASLIMNQMSNDRVQLVRFQHEGRFFHTFNFKDNVFINLVFVLVFLEELSI